MTLTRDGFLGGKVQAWQPARGYRATSDAVMLAAAVPARPGEQVLELGCGAGVASLCLHARVPDLTITGVEIQPDYAELARRNAAENGATFKIIEGDFTKRPPGLRELSVDHVLMNPPFFTASSTARDAGRAIARHEETPLADWVDCARKRLKPKGWLTLILPIERFPEIVEELGEGFGDMAARPIAARANQNAKRFILKARKGGGGPFTLCQTVILHQGLHHAKDQNDYTEFAEQILRHGGELPWT